MTRRVGRLFGPLLCLAWLLVAAAPVAGPDFTTAERRYLADHPVLRVGVGSGQLPFQDVVRDPDGAARYQGLAADYLDALAPLLGVAFAPALDVSYTQALELARTGGIDLIACINDTPGRRAVLHLTQPYSSLPYVMIARLTTDSIRSMAELAGRTVAVAPSFFAYERLQSEHPDLGIRFEFKRNVPEAVAEVAAGRADACFLNLAAAAGVIRERGYDDLGVVSVMPWPNNTLSMASPDPTLAAILDKALAAIPQERKIALAARWFDAPAPSARGGGARSWYWIGVAGLAVAGLLWGWWGRRRRAELFRLKAVEADCTGHKHVLEAVLNATSDAILLLDETYRVRMVNTTGAARFGLLPEDMIGLDLLALTEAPVAQARRERYRQVQETGLPAHFTDERAGRVYENIIYPIRSEDGGRPHLAVYARDITERLAAEAVVRESQERLATIFRLFPATICVNSLPDGRFLEVNEAFTAATGIAREDAIDRTPRELGLSLAKDDEDRVAQAVARDGLVRNLELPLRAPSGHLHTILLSCIPIEAGGQPCMLSVSVDITDRKTMEEALRLAKDSAEAANRAKSRFLSTMSHEIRTPMNTILGMVDVLRGTPLSERQQEFLGTLEVAGESLMALLSDILELSKIESGILDLESVPYDPVELLHQTAAVLGVQAKAKGLALRLEVAKDVPREACGDPTRIRQILINLTGNAVKFTAKGEVVLSLARLPARSSRDDLLYGVSDTGIGIPQDKQETIFKPFTQLDSSTTRAYGGTGLGLAISALLADGMDSRLWVESAPGAGSTFYFAVPLDCRGRSGRPQAPAEPTSAPDLTQAPTGRRSLLIVEDSEPNRQLYEALLEDLPLSVTYAVTGGKALECFEANTFDAVIMDIKLPDIDGLTVIEEIRRREAAAGRAATPILVITAFAFREESGRAKAARATALLTKPIQKNRFLAVLAHLFGLRTAGSLPDAPAAWTTPPDPQ
ncbi:MAG: ATP-binding protein [Acidobacteriota bacterium]